MGENSVVPMPKAPMASAKRPAGRKVFRPPDGTSRYCTHVDGFLNVPDRRKDREGFDKPPVGRARLAIAVMSASSSVNRRGYSRRCAQGSRFSTARCDPLHQPAKTDLRGALPYLAPIIAAACPWHRAIGHAVIGGHGHTCIARSGGKRGLRQIGVQL